MPQHRRSHLFLVAALIALVTASIYAQAIRFEFVSFDDPLYLEQVPQIKLGLSWPAIKWAFTGVHLANWHPLTTISYLTEYQFFGFNPKVYHLNNVILHVINSVLLLWVLFSMTGAEWRSAFVAALFALHPLHVESVAWVSERKDVLSMFFLLLTLAAYTRYAHRGGWRRFAVVLIAFACGLMCKPMLVSLPLLLLLLDIWPLKRATSWPKLILEKVPLLVLAAASSAVTFLAQHISGAVATLTTVPLYLRVQNAVVAYGAYLLKTVWPAKLAVFYPFQKQYEGWSVALAALIIVSILIWQQRKARPFLIVGWAWFLISLVPVIGIVQVGQQAYADRYTYIPLLGVFIMIAWGGWDLLSRLRRGRELATVVSLAILAALTIVSYVQIGYWRTTETLFAQAARVAPSANSHMALGDALAHRGQTDEALGEYLQAERINENSFEAQSRLALLYMRRSEMDKAAIAIDKAITVLDRITTGRTNLEKDPRYVETLYNLGVVRLGQDKVDDAAPLVEQAYKHSPEKPTYVAGLAVLRNRQGRFDEAITLARRAIELDRNGIDGWGALATAYRQLGQIEEAAKALKEVVRLTPKDMSARIELVGLLTRLGRSDEAIAQARDAINVDTRNGLIHLRLGALLQISGQTADAINEYRRAIELDPQSGARNNLAWLRATTKDAQFRDGAEAVRLAEAVHKEAGNRAEVLDTLAAAYAETGKFDRAVQTAEAAIAAAGSDEKFAAELRVRLDLYKQGKPYHE